MIGNTISGGGQTILSSEDRRPYRQQPSATSIHQLLSLRVAASPEAVAVMAPNRRPLTYRRLLNQVEATVAALRGFRLGRNDRVAVVLPNGPCMAVACAGVAAGATCAPLNPSYRASEFEFYLADLEAKALLVEWGLDSPAREVAQRRGIPILEVKQVADGDAGVFEFCGVRAAAAEMADSPLPKTRRSCCTLRAPRPVRRSCP